MTNIPCECTQQIPCSVLPFGLLSFNILNRNTTPEPHPQRRQFLQLPFWLTKMRSREDGQTSIHVLPFKALPLSLLQARSNFLCYELTKIGTHQLICTCGLHEDMAGILQGNMCLPIDPPTSGFISWDLIIQHNPLSSQKPRSWRRPKATAKHEDIPFG